MNIPADIQKIIDIARRIHSDGYIQTSCCGCGCCCSSNHESGADIDHELKIALSEFDSNNS